MTEPVMMQFQSLDEMFAWQQSQTAKANAVLSDEQRAVTYGDTWIRFWLTFTGEMVAIFGRVSTKQEVHDAEHKGVTTEEDKAEADFTTARVYEMHEAGYLFGWAWSVIEPEGEPGDTHRANLWPIPEETFTAVKELGWDVYHTALSDEHRANIERAYQGYRQWTIQTRGAW